MLILHNKLRLQIDVPPFVKYQYEIDSDLDCSRILVCNNACWAIGEIAICAPEQVIQSFVVIINTLADLLNSDIINQLTTEKENEMVKHFAKTISITLGRLGKMDP